MKLTFPPLNQICHWSSQDTLLRAQQVQLQQPKQAGQADQEQLSSSSKKTTSRGVNVYFSTLYQYCEGILSNIHVVSSETLVTKHIPNCHKYPSRKFGSWLWSNIYLKIRIKLFQESRIKNTFFLSYLLLLIILFNKKSQSLNVRHFYRRPLQPLNCTIIEIMLALMSSEMNISFWVKRIRVLWWLVNRSCSNGDI